MSPIDEYGEFLNRIRKRLIGYARQGYQIVGIVIDPPEDGYRQVHLQVENGSDLSWFEMWDIDPVYR